MTRIFNFAAIVLKVKAQFDEWMARFQKKEQTSAEIGGRLVSYS